MIMKTRIIKKILAVISILLLIPTAIGILQLAAGDPFWDAFVFGLGVSAVLGIVILILYLLYWIFEK